MLDLNLNVNSADLAQNNNYDSASASMVLEEMTNPQGSGTQMDESGTSNSSIVNADASSNGGDDESCSTRAAGSEVYTFSFDILKVGAGGESDGVVVTRELFPMGQSSSASSSSRKNWIELGFDQSKGSVVGGEVGMLQQQSQSPPQPQPQPLQQPVKKSRRGPRSRSSQYRGVTFYRRTGRWESHIW